jgi:HSP20 family molecular chaperone IbpA
MKTIYFLILASLFFTSNTAAQGGLEALVNAVSSEIGTVKTGRSDTYQQQLEFVREHPWKVTLLITKTDRKDREEKREYRFNLGDLDKNTVRISSNKSEQIVKANTIGRSDFISYFEDGEADGFTDYLEIRAADIDQARKIKEVLEAAILPARDAWQSYSKVEGNTAELMQWLKEKVGPTKVKDEMMEQTLTYDSQMKDRLRIDRFVSEEDERSAYSLSLADLDPERLKIEVKDDRIYVQGRTIRNADFIEYFEDGEFDSFESSFQLYFSELEGGRQAIAVLDSLIRYGSKEMKNRMPSPGSLDNALQLLSEQVKDFTGSKYKYEQQLKPELESRYLLKETELDDGDEEVKEYLFHFGDMDEKDVEIETSRSTVKVELDTRDNLQYIEYIEDGETDDFTSSLEIYASSIEHARIIRHLAEYIITEAAKIPTEVKDWNWLKQAVADGSTDEVSQKIAIQEGADTPCKLILTVVDKEEEEEEIFEFNTYDLNVNRVKIDVSNEIPGLFVRTIDGDDIIKHYENGRPGFTNDIKIRLQTISAAKIAVETMKEMIDGCRTEKE